MNHAIALLKTSYAEWRDDKGSRLAAALAFYTLLSMAPLLVLAVSIVGLIFGAEAARGELTEKLHGLMGPQAAGGVETLLAAASSRKQGLLAAGLSIVVSFFGASGVFGELQDSFNTIWEVVPRPGRGVTGVEKDRIFSFAMVLGVALLLFLSLVVSTALSAVGGTVQGAGQGTRIAPLLSIFWSAVNLVVSLGMATVLFAVVFKVLPDVHIPWRSVWVGGLATAVLFTIGKYLLGVYLGRASVASPYGAAGSVVVMILWVYYSSQILFFGAEFTQVYARDRGEHVTPTHKAVPMSWRFTHAEG